MKGKTGCTISVSEGNYDSISIIFISPPPSNVALFPFLKGITTGKRGLYLINLFLEVALFPFLKGITTSCSKTKTWEGMPFSLHYFRFWRELRPVLPQIEGAVRCHNVLHYFRFWRELRLTLNFTIIPSPKSSCTISVSEGNYDCSSCHSSSGNASLSGCTISVSEGNYDTFPRKTLKKFSASMLHYFRFWRELRPAPFLWIDNCLHLGLFR